MIFFFKFRKYVLPRSKFRSVNISAISQNYRNLENMKDFEGKKLADFIFNRSRYVYWNLTVLS